MIPRTAASLGCLSPRTFSCPDTSHLPPEPLPFPSDAAPCQRAPQGLALGLRRTLKLRVSRPSSWPRWCSWFVKQQNHFWRETSEEFRFIKLVLQSPRGGRCSQAARVPWGLLPVLRAYPGRVLNKPAPYGGPPLTATLTGRAGNQKGGFQHS